MSPFWDDLMIAQDTNQGVYYEVIDETVTFEWLLSRSGNSSDLYQFQLLYNSAQPGIVKYRYFATGNGGSTASIGVQGCELHPKSLSSNLNRNRMLVDLFFANRLFHHI
jgi:hypothetical protein